MDDCLETVVCSIRTLEEVRVEQDAQIQRLKAALDKATTQLVALQSDHHAMSQEAAETSANAAKKMRVH